jgi:hypothetical protein
MRAFESGSFDGMTDCYDYKKGSMKIASPDGVDLDFTTKYGFEHFVTKEQYDKFYK